MKKVFFGRKKKIFCYAILSSEIFIFLYFLFVFFLTKKKRTKNTPASIHENKLKWTKLAADLNVFLPENSQKTAKQCRERWINHLNPRMNKSFLFIYILIKIIKFLEDLGSSKKISN